MRVLLAEDDPMIGASVRRGLAQDGFAVDWVEDGRAAQVALAEHVHDALVLDLGLPRQAGLEVLTAMRRAGDTRPVLITTARDAIADRVAGLDAGADDYLVKPFDLDELAARLRALLRRGTGRAAPKIAFGPLEL
ncbi:MAG TPA: response regulator, partial [Casimicrobiaceae bacterium]|nr:response regulator [Casimicrobiaceae bacterium]